MHFINEYHSKFVDFKLPVFYHHSNYFPTHWSDNLQKSEKDKKPNKKKEKVDKAKYVKFVKNFKEITLNVTKNTKKISLEATKKIYQTINQKVFDPTEAEKKYFNKFGLPHSVQKHKKVYPGSKDFEAHYDWDTVESGLRKGDFIEGNLRANEFNSRVAFVPVEGLENDVIILSEKDQNRAFDRDLVVLKLIDPKWWEPMKRGGSGQDNEKPIEDIILEHQKEEKGLKVEENSGDNAAVDDQHEHEDPAIQEEDIHEENIHEEDNQEEDNQGEDNGEEDIQEEEKVEIEDEEIDPSSEHDKSVMQLIKEMEVKRKEKKGKREEREESGLHLPSNINSQEEMINWMNTVAKDFRPKAKVIYIKESVHFEKDVVMILRIGEKAWLHKVHKAKPEEKERLISEGKADLKTLFKKLKLLAVPINKRLKWGIVETLPNEFWEDILKGDDP